MNRLWMILATLTLARMTMGFQFQSVAALGPRLTGDAFITHTELGMLIGVYLLPGALFAIPGGWLGKRFGDKRVVLTGLAMMTLGGALLALSTRYEVMFSGRLLSGLGAVLLNVLATKMVTDWFDEQRLASAMGVLISSWPLGIAIALLSMNPLEAAFGLQSALLVAVAGCAVATLMLAVLYSDPPRTAAQTSPTPAPTRLTRYERDGVLLSGAVWCLYNGAFILTLSFAPGLLAAQDVTLNKAGAIVSLASWVVIPALPLGAWAAERIGRPVATMVFTFVALIALIWSIPYAPANAVIFIAIGLVFGPAGGLIMALPAQVLQPENRAVGMGIFFTVYYLGMGIFPSIAGFALDTTGNLAAPLWLAGFIILLALLALAGFCRLKARGRKSAVYTQ